ncbi:glutamine cyclotransferase [Tenacibaculum todarodis]|uniref:Glutamine cyclotransferase n=1 Tax=Tenacibaculum todarodis TaxID=1850252 RepID=A0A1L3JFQ3_9FLAO|nr:glutaminyl-peptide cyclotransferase [Tenacibaculum todarodis]APG63944.1 glutamine cyclotransferase [Tenacibaculum todarodis]
MYKSKLLLVVFTATILLSACKSGYKFKLTSPKKTTLGKSVAVSLEEINGNAVDSIQFFVNNKKIASKGATATINTTNLGVGKHAVTAVAFYPEKAKKVNNTIEVFATKAPDVYSYKIVNTFPHDKKAYTQGLEFNNGFLYETTGRKGQSWLRKVDYKTGEVLQQEDLSSTYFGEGMTIFNDKVFWLTWQAGKGFVYDVNSFKQEKSFEYFNSKEGWGLTHNDTELIKSDGTNRIWFLDPVTLKEKRSIQAYTNKVSLQSLNELEYINGKIYANYWQKPLIAIINPENGTVDGIVDLTNLVKEMKKTQKLDDADDVLNGIAFDAKNNRMFVTGKHWSKLFEIELVKK